MKKPARGSLVKIADTNNHLSGVGYDAAGNETSDSSGGSFVYDAESRIVSTAGVTYTYDADGRRVKKSSGPITGMVRVVQFWPRPIRAAIGPTTSLSAAGGWPAT